MQTGIYVASMQAIMPLATPFFSVIESNEACDDKHPGGVDFVNAVGQTPSGVLLFLRLNKGFVSGFLFQ